MLGILRKIAIIFFALLVLVLGCAFFVIKSKIGTAAFRTAAEAKMGELLHAEVRIKKIRVGFLNRIALSGLEINYRDSRFPNSQSVATRIPKVVFRYDFSQIFRRNLTAPAAVVFENPSVFVDPSGASNGLAQLSDLMNNLRGISGLEVEGASLRCAIPSLKSELGLQNLTGSLLPSRGGKIRINVRAQASGPLEGNIRVLGHLDLAGREHRLVLYLDSARFGRALGIPLQDIKGKVRIEGENIFFDDLHASIHGWKSVLSGRVLHYAQPEPVIYLDSRIGKGAAHTRIVLNADMPQKRITGSIVPSQVSAIVFEGNIYREGMLLVFDSLKVNGRYASWGKLDFDTGGYQIFVEDGKQRVSVVSNLKGLQFQVKLVLDHVKLAGLDVVTSTRLRLKPLGRWEEPQWKFQGTFKTDYFILERMPFNDFSGSLELGPEGIRNLQGSWGRQFQVSGEVGILDLKPKVKLLVQIDGFDLSQVREFAAKPLPKRLGGILDGRLKIEGLLVRPEVSGDFGIKKGRLGRLEYDRGIIHFRGIMPYLPLYGSRILKGRTSLDLEGALNLSSENIFYGVEIRSADKLAQWRAASEYP